MRSIHLSFILALCLCGCVAAGTPAASDPGEMLLYADEMVKENRLETAEGLIDSSISRYSELQDANGLAEAYYAMGCLYKSPRFESALDGTTLTDYDKSLSYLALAEEQYRSAKNYGGIIKSQWAMGTVYAIKRDFGQACNQYRRSGDSYREMMQKSPEQEKNVKLVSGFGSFPSMLQAFKIKFDCR